MLEIDIDVFSRHLCLASLELIILIVYIYFCISSVLKIGDLVNLL